jgi:hypothetical protein
MATMRHKSLSEFFFGDASDEGNSIKSELLDLR